MAEVLLYHHIQGLTDGLVEFADELRREGHTVHTPDLFGGRVFDSIKHGFAFAKGTGLEEIRRRGLAEAERLIGTVGGSAEGTVYAGFSFGVTLAQELAQTTSGARGALLINSCIPVSEYSESWPAGVPVQIHGKIGDEFFVEDYSAATALVASSPDAELFTYPGDQHLFADSSLPAYDSEAAELLMSRVKAFLAAL